MAGAVGIDRREGAARRPALSPVAAFVLRRAGLTVITLVLVSLLLFGAAEVIPGDVGRRALGPYASAEQVAALDRELGADRPLPQRYGGWAADFVRGDWGRSTVLDVPVRPLVLDRLGHSLALALFALVLVVPVAIGLGVLAALHAGRLLDRVVSIAGLSLIAVPEFVVGVLLLVALAVNLGWFPVSSGVPSADPVDVLRQLTLPALPLMALLFGYLSRMARAGAAQVLATEYVRTASLKGLAPRTVVRRHVLRNALLPSVNVVGAQLGYLVGGLVVTETLFGYPGIGRLLLDAALGHDLPTLEACVLLTALVTMGGNLLADVVAATLDPRLRPEEA